MKIEIKRYSVIIKDNRMNGKINPCVIPFVKQILTLQVILTQIQ